MRRGCFVKLSAVSVLSVFIFISFPGCLRTNTDLEAISHSGDTCSATECHLATVLKQTYPVSGMHLNHINSNSIYNIGCRHCHSTYPDSYLHKNGVVDGASGEIVVFNSDIAGSSASWDKSTTTCSSLNCHGNANWYDNPVKGCALCHKNSVGSRRQIVDSNGNGTGSGGDFNMKSHHVINYNNGNIQIVKKEDCLVCHDQSNHMRGTVLLNDKDNSGNSIIYDPDDPSSLEPFCLSCHDIDGASAEADPFSPFTSDNILGTTPNRAGVEIRKSWEKRNGHRREGLTCMGDGTPGSGCHGNYDQTAGTGSVNAHGSGNAGLLANKMNLPVPFGSFDEENYRLCLDCHDNYPSVLSLNELVGIGSGSNYARWGSDSYNLDPYSVEFMVSGFHDYKARNYDKQFNLHLMHLRDGTWKYRGVAGNNGYGSCVTCHNVHGTAGQYYLWDDWGFSIEMDSGVEYGKLASANFSGTRYPEFCAASCHWDPLYRYPRTNFNEAYASSSISSGSLSAGDTVTINFSHETNGISLVSGSGTTGPDFGIDNALPLESGNLWGSITAVWSNSNRTLTITIVTPDGTKPVSVGDKLTLAPYQVSSTGHTGMGYDEYDLFDWSITDTAGVTYRGSVTIMGSNEI